MSLDYQKSIADRQAEKTGNPYQVVWSESGGYQTFPERFGLPIGFKRKYVTGEKDE